MGWLRSLFCLHYWRDAVMGEYPSFEPMGYASRHNKFRRILRDPLELYVCTKCGCKKWLTDIGALNYGEIK